MFRMVVAVIGGYVVMVAAAIAGIAVQWQILGAEGAFQTGTTEASTSWAVINCLVGLLAAVAGGTVAAAIGRHPIQLPVKALACFVLGFGLVLAFLQRATEPAPLPEGKTTADLTFSEAGSVARSPNWYNFAIPLIGAAGVLVGGRLQSKRKTAYPLKH